jgi:release factor glutamine methyltransferase
VFRPCSDSWILADALRRETVALGAKILDLCAGSGVLAVTAATHAAGVTAVHVTAVDISRRAVATTRINARLNGVSVRAIRGDLFAAVEGERFALIVSNPPYLPSVGGGPAPHHAAVAWEAGQDGRAILDRICARAPERLVPGGVLLLVHSSVCGEQPTLAALREHGLETRVVARNRGPLGPRLATRAAWLRERGLLASAAPEEEILVIRAQRPGGRAVSRPVAPRAKARESQPQRATMTDTPPGLSTRRAPPRDSNRRPPSPSAP